MPLSAFILMHCLCCSGNNTSEMLVGSGVSVPLCQISLLVFWVNARNACDSTVTGVSEKDSDRNQQLFISFNFIINTEQKYISGVPPLDTRLFKHSHHRPHSTPIGPAHTRQSYTKPANHRICALCCCYVVILFERCMSG